MFQKTNIVSDSTALIDSLISQQCHSIDNQPLNIFICCGLTAAQEEFWQSCETIRIPNSDFWTNVRTFHITDCGKLSYEEKPYNGKVVNLYFTSNLTNICGYLKKENFRVFISKADLNFLNEVFDVFPESHIDVMAVTEKAGDMLEKFNVPFEYAAYGLEQYRIKGTIHKRLYPMRTVTMDKSEAKFDPNVIDKIMETFKN